MSFFRYLRDNIRFIALYFVLAGFLVAMAYLDGQNSMQTDNAVYTALVSFVLFSSCVCVDYAIRLRHAKRLAELTRSADHAPVLPEPVDYRDELYTAYIHELYGQYTAAIRSTEDDSRENKEFMVAWAHEVKMPITAARLLLEGEPGEAEVSSLREEIGRINESVEKVLFYSRSDSFSRDYIIAEEVLERLVKDNVKKQSALFIKKHIRVAIDVPAELTVFTDRKWLLFILDQLLSNALKYTGIEGEIVISARQDGRETVLSYKDNGKGIKQEDIARVFAKSFTGQNGREPGSAATGLGLYLAQKLAGKLSHNITLSSRYGEGTTVEVHFPVCAVRVRL